MDFSLVSVAGFISDYTTSITTGIPLVLGVMGVTAGVSWLFSKLAKAIRIR